MVHTADSFTIHNEDMDQAIAMDIPYGRTLVKREWAAIPVGTEFWGFA